MTNYQKGIRFERKVRSFLRRRGCHVFRQASSQFPDLIAFKNGVVYLIECKMRGYLTRDERELLLKLALMSGGMPMLAKCGTITGSIVISLVHPRSDPIGKRRKLEAVVKD